MKKYVWSNKKGGVGKTTGTINLAGALARLGYKVLVVDMEAQANASFVFLGTRIPEPSIYDLLIDQDGDVSLSEVIYQTQVENVDIIPSHKEKMDGAERDFSNLIGQQVLLSNRLQELDNSTYDFIVIDSPPNLGILTVNSLTAADEVIVPIKPGVFAMQGIEDLFKIIKLVRERLKIPLKVAGFILNEVERTNVSKDVYSELNNHFGEQVFKTQIPKNVSLEEAHSRLGTVFQHSPESKGAQAYMSLVEELLNHD